MSVNRVIVATALLAAVGLSGCTSTRQALGMTKVTPDEFRVVTKAPLVVPPDFALRPPAPGKPRPQELQPESAARVALLGQREGEARSDGEKLLVAKAGADKADPLIRYVVDDEFGGGRDPTGADGGEQTIDAEDAVAQRAVALGERHVLAQLVRHVGRAAGALEDAREQARELGMAQPVGLRHGIVGQVSESR